MKFALILILIQAAAPAAPKSSIEGIVLKAGTEIPQPIANARINLETAPGAGKVIRTTSGGRFALSDLAPGRYRLIVEKDGFARHTAQITLTPGQQMKE